MTPTRIPEPSAKRSQLANLRFHQGSDQVELRSSIKPHGSAFLRNRMSHREECNPARLLPTNQGGGSNGLPEWNVEPHSEALNRQGDDPMSDQPLTAEVSSDTQASTPGNGICWGEQAPRGGRAALNRMLKGGLFVPMFFGQTLIKSLREQGYNSTTAALWLSAARWPTTPVPVSAASVWA